MTNKKVLFCWSGGGLSGLDIHLGIWKALDEAGIESTDNAGTSAGAIMAAFNSTTRTAAGVERILRPLRDEDVRARRLLWELRIPWIDSFLSPSPIRGILEAYLPANFRSLFKPCEVMATNDESGTCICLDEFAHMESEFGLIDAIMASMAIAGVFPQVDITLRGIGRLSLSDGGTSNYIALPSNLTRYDEVYLLVVDRPLSYKKRGIITRLMYNIDLLLKDQLNDTIESARREHSHVHVIRPVIPTSKGALHFDHDLIEMAYTQTKKILEAE